MVFNGEMIQDAGIVEVELSLGSQKKDAFLCVKRKGYSHSGVARFYNVCFVSELHRRLFDQWRRRAHPCHAIKVVGNDKEVSIATGIVMQLKLSLTGLVQICKARVRGHRVELRGGSPLFLCPRETITII